MSEIIRLDPDASRTEAHEKAVVVMARKHGRDPHGALAESRALRAWAAENGHDLRLSYRDAAGAIRTGSLAAVTRRQAAKPAASQPGTSAASAPSKSTEANNEG